MGMVRSAAKAIVRRMAAGLEDLAASSLLEEALEVLTEVAAPHWNGSTIADVPEMIRELARDRDDYKRMAETYRAQLAEHEQAAEEAIKRQREINERLRLLCGDDFEGAR